MALGALEELAVDPDVIASGVSFAAEFGDDFAVDLDAPRGDEFFGVAAAGDPGLGEDLLQAFQAGRRWCCLLVFVGDF
jgi:hypothetical protein